MKYLTRHWQSRTLILLLLSSVVGLGMWGLELSEWAAEINAQSAQVNEHGREGRETPPAALIAILPFIKWLVFTLLPASMVVGVRAL